MKVFFATFVFCSICLTAVSQNCKGYYYLSNNTTVVMTTYDKKNAESGKLTYKISNVTTSGNNTTGNYSSEMVDTKGKTLSKGEGKYKCTGGIMYLDARVALPQENMAAYKDMDVKADEIFIEYPASMSAGQTLNDVDFTMTIENKGKKFAEITLKQTSRKVEAKESVTTAAGTWECWKITYEGNFRAGIGPIGIPVNYKGVEWFAPGFGIVKTETYSKNGKYAGATMITSINK